MSILKNIFSITKTDSFYILNILGIKIKKRYNKKEQDKKNCFVNKSLCLQNLYKTHSEVFSQFKNINVGKDVAIIATGPTLAKYQPIENTVNIGLNRAYQYDKVKLDYLFLQDGTATKDYIKEIDNLSDIHKFYGRILFNETYREKICIPEYHLLNEKCYQFYSYGYHDAEIKPNIEVYPLFTSASIAFPAIHFALFTHPKKIYLVGCDTTSAPYWDGKNREQDFLNIEDKVTKMMLDGYLKLKEFVEIYYPDVEIISVNPVGLKGLFKDLIQGEQNVQD